MSTLAKAIRIAAVAHEPDKDKAGRPYVLHPIRVMMRMRTEEERIVAVLHDVVEDTDWTLEGLRREGFTEEIVQAVDRLTKRPGESYDDSVQRAAGDPIARRVKLADLEDNMDPRRLRELTPEHRERLERYHRAWRKLGGADAS